jgi:hypothetical protein
MDGATTAAPQWTYGLDLTLQGVQHAVGSIDRPGVHWHVRAAQALFWICAFDEQFHKTAGYKGAREKDPNGQIINGLRFARNAVAHAVTPLAEISPENPGAVIKGDGWTSVSGPLRWRPSSDIRKEWPDMRSNNQKLISTYDQLVSGCLLEMPVQIAYRWVRTWMRDAYGAEIVQNPFVAFGSGVDRPERDSDGG